MRKRILTRMSIAFHTPQHQTIFFINYRSPLSGHSFNRAYALIGRENYSGALIGLSQGTLAVLSEQIFGVSFNIQDVRAVFTIAPIVASFSRNQSAHETSTGKVRMRLFARYSFWTYFSTDSHIAKMKHLMRKRYNLLKKENNIFFASSLPPCSRQKGLNIMVRASCA